MFGKRGQFFLVAALVISGILIGLATIYTKVDAPKENTAVYDLSQELNYESLQVIDQGVFTGLTQEQLNNQIINLTAYYVAKEPNKEFVVVYGDSDSITVNRYSKSDAGNAGISTGGRLTSETIQINQNTQEQLNPSQEELGKKVCLKFFNDREVCYNLRQGQNFIAGVSFTDKNQSYVAVGED